MPTTHAHYKFGEEVMEALPRSLRESIVKNRQLYDIGLHGPDILFYIFSPFKGYVRKTGTGLHKQPGRAFFEHARKVIKTAPNPVAARAYIYGFITHFVLDSECHKYVEKMIEESKVGHNEIETEFDAYLLKQEGRKPLAVDRTKHLQPSFKNAQIIAPFFNGFNMKTKPSKDNVMKTITPLDIKRTITAQIVIHKILSARTDRQRNMVSALTRLRSDGHEIIELMINKQPNPKCTNYNVILKKVYSASIPLAVSLILQYQKYLLQGDDLSARFDQAYDEGEDWMKIVL